MKILKTFGAPCHVCNSTGVIRSSLGDYECTICNGTGVTKLTSESDPILLEVFTVPTQEHEPAIRDTLFIDERNATYLCNIVDESLIKEREAYELNGNDSTKVENHES